MLLCSVLKCVNSLILNCVLENSSKTVHFFKKRSSTDRTSAHLMRQSIEINTSGNKFQYVLLVVSLAKYKPSGEVWRLSVPLVTGKSEHTFHIADCFLASPPPPCKQVIPLTTYKNNLRETIIKGENETECTVQHSLAQSS